MNENLIYEIATATTLQESLTLFKNNKEKLTGYKFIFSSSKGSIPGYTVNYNFTKGSAIRGLFKGDKVYMLDTETVTEMFSDTGNSIFPIDYSISLDTQIVSYLNSCIASEKGSPVFKSSFPDDFNEILEFISRKEVSIDPLPYEFENYTDLKHSSQRIFKQIKGYEFLRNIDREAFIKHNIVKTLISEEDLIKNSQNYISRLYQNLSDSHKIKDTLFDSQYLYLLKMIVINLENSNLSAFDKTIKFLNFCNDEVFVIGIRELLIANEYFKKKQNLKFFGKIQKNQKSKDKFFQHIKGMAWDLFHIRQMERYLTTLPDSRARYFFPALLTADKRLIKILELTSLKCCVYNADKNIIIPFFELDIFEHIPGTPEQRALLEEYYTLSMKEKRSNNLHSSELNLRIMQSKLEETLWDIVKID